MVRVPLTIVSVATVFLLGATAFSAQSDTAAAATNASELEVVDGVLTSAMNATAGPLVLVVGAAFVAVVLGFILGGVAK